MLLLAMQVEHLSTPCGASNARLLQQMEMHMLLTLMVHQLTASIPASYPGAKEARIRACYLNCTPSLWPTTSLHRLPLPAAYTGPQLALQAMPSLVGGQHSRQQCRPSSQQQLL